MLYIHIRFEGLQQGAGYQVAYVPFLKSWGDHKILLKKQWRQFGRLTFYTRMYCASSILTQRLTVSNKILNCTAFTKFLITLWPRCSKGLLWTSCMHYIRIYKAGRRLIPQRDVKECGAWMQRWAIVFGKKAVNTLVLGCGDLIQCSSWLHPFRMLMKKSNFLEPGTIWLAVVVVSKRMG